MKLRIIVLSTLSAFVFFGCAHTSHDGHDHAADEDCSASATEATAVVEGDGHGEHGADVILMGDDQATALGLTFEKTTKAPFASVIRTGGSLEAAPGDRSTVIATTSGIVSFGGRRLTDGTRVTKGTPLLTLGSAGMVDGNYPQQLADARAALSKAEADYTRAETLSKTNVVSGADLNAAKLAVDLARNKVTVLSANATKGGKSILTPQGGYITSLLVGEGDYVTAGQPLASISANRNLVLRADLPQRHLPETGQIETANFTTPYDGRNYDLIQMGGRLIGSARAVAEGSSTLPVRFEFENQENLTPGSVVEVFLKGTPRENVLTIPTAALTEEQGAYYVYVRTSPGHYKKHAVTTGATDGVRIEIVSGLSIGDDVVTRGAYYVRLASMSTAIPHGHTH